MNSRFLSSAVAYRTRYGGVPLIVLWQGCSAAPPLWYQHPLLSPLSFCFSRLSRRDFSTTLPRCRSRATTRPSRTSTRSTFTQVASCISRRCARAFCFVFCCCWPLLLLGRRLLYYSSRGIIAPFFLGGGSSLESLKASASPKDQRNTRKSRGTIS